MGRSAILVAAILLCACAAETPEISQPDPKEQPTQAEVAPTTQEAVRADEPTAPPEEPMQEDEFKLLSAAFEQGEPIPAEYSCDDQDSSPRLTWTHPPEGTQSFALIMDDPDASVGTWVHWVLFNLPPETRSLPEAVGPDATLGNGAIHGTNSWNRLGYGGPCPPGGVHRYFFKLYALDTILDLDIGASKDQVLAAMEGHIVAQAELMGTYAR